MKNNELTIKELNMISQVLLDEIFRIEDDGNEGHPLAQKLNEIRKKIDAIEFDRKQTMNDKKLNRRF
jgi:hypothetical protein